MGTLLLSSENFLFTYLLYRHLPPEVLIEIMILNIFSKIFVEITVLSPIY